MQKVENDLYVSVQYTGTLDSGEEFDSSKGRPPLEVRIGAGNVIPGFESALMGMTLNESKTFTLSPEEAYGLRDDSRTHEFPKADMPQGMDLELGQVLALTTKDGQQIPARVDRIDDDVIQLDLNHPLAGQSLTFAIEVVGISETATQVSAGCGCGSSCADSACGCEDSGCR
jgi:peptidylprolyl isomerase